MMSLSTAPSFLVVVICATVMKGKTTSSPPCSLSRNECTCTQDKYECSWPKEPLQEVPLDIPSTVTQIDLSGNTISILTNSSFSNLNNLTFLNLNQNGLRRIQPDAFSDLRNLQTLDLSENIIEELDARHFATFDNLQKLNVTQNPHLNISINAFQNAPSLTEIMADENFNSGHYDFSDLTQLETIHLEGCKVRVFYKDNFRNLPTLKRLLLSQNELIDFPTSIIEQLPLLEELTLAGNFIRDIQSYDFSNNQNLSVLDLSRNQIERLDGTGLRSLGALRHLDLTNNRIKSLSQDSLPNPPFAYLVMQLKSNPLLCDCNLKWLVSYLRDQPKIRFLGRCKEPVAMEGRDLVTSKEGDFVCRPWKRSSSILSHVVSISQPATLSCPVNGDPMPSITWSYHNHTTKSNEAVDSRFVKHNVQGNKVHFDAVTFDRAGLYVCRAANKVGAIEVSLALTVIPSSGIASDPVCSCKKPIILIMVLFLTIVCGLCAVLFVYRKYLKAARVQRNLAYANLHENEGEAI